MKRFLVALSTLIVPLAIAATPAAAQTAARQYDCTKAGNANKTVCKNAAAAAAAPKPATTRNYDCTKAGNANKAACKGVATAAPAAKPANDNVATAAAPKPRNYDCSKAGNANKTACKGVAAAPAPAPKAAPAPRVAPAPATRTVTGQNTNPAGPNGATAKCRDNTYSQSANRSGTCSRHGGVAQWY